MELICFTYQGKKRRAKVVQAIPENTVNMLYILDDELQQTFGNCFLFNHQGNFYPCNDKGRRDEVATLLYVLYRELYRLKLVV
mgnify:CR=1 FL=1